MSIRKHSEAQIFEALKQVDAGRTVAEVGYLRSTYGPSERRTCELMRLPCRVTDTGSSGRETASCGRSGWRWRERSLASGTEGCTCC